MDTVHEKLDEAMAEIQKLRADYKIKAESSENFKRAYNKQLIKQLIKIRDASSNVDKLTLELSMKEDELSVAKQAYEELKSNLKDKEAAIKFLSSANGRLRADYDSKLKKFEEENRSMAVALDETNAANMEQEQKIQTLKNEMHKLNTNLES
nr:putative centromere protein [Ipomoea batatas]